MAARWSEADLPLFAEANKRINDPERALASVAAEAKDCTRCPLYRNAPQTVFGEGPADAALMLVGEQPGDQEDIAGRPFVGPAGKVLDRALEAAEIERASVYVTNGVKHFKNEPRGIVLVAAAGGCRQARRVRSSRQGFTLRCASLA